MIIEIKNPSPELEEAILNNISTDKRFKSYNCYYIITLRASMDIFTKCVSVFVHNTIHCDMYLKYIEGNDCTRTEICKENFYDICKEEVNYCKSS